MEYGSKQIVKGCMNRRQKMEDGVNLEDHRMKYKDGRWR